MTEIILLKKYDIFLKKNNIISNDINIIFLELCKIKNIKHTIIDEFMSFNILDINKSYIYVFNNFINSDDKNIINNIDIIKYFIIYLDSNNITKLINYINNIIHKYIDNKDIYSALKSLCIDCNKFLLKKISYILNIIKNTQNIKRIIFYIKKIYLNFDTNNNNNNVDYNEIIDIVQNILNNNEIKDESIEIMLKLINKCKMKINKKDNELENILYKSDKNIYEYIYFLKNDNNILDNVDKILEFLVYFNYNKKCFQEIDKLNLKRGFIKGLCKNNKNYLLKYQPNKSVMELVLNCCVKLINTHHFLIPKFFFINSDNSYFYIIEKYNTDLYKYFNILNENNKILSFKKIISISFFIANSIKILHKNNIIHSDLKLENIVLNYDDNNDITELKIIDFDVGLFNKIPETLMPIHPNYEKVFNNKKMRGTRIYMLKEKVMSFNNDIYSLGVISLVLLYKNIKLLLNIKKKSIIDNSQKNKKLIIIYHSLLKKLNYLRDNIEDNDNKIKMINILEDYFKLNRSDLNIFFDDIIDINIFINYKSFILDCINIKYNINELIVKYKSIFDVL
jgi:serine/threonine protein kinase